MWTRTRVTELLKLDYPIFQGPFGGGVSTPALTAAVSNAGGLGGFGAVDLAPDELRRAIKELASRTARPFNVNLWVPIAGEVAQVDDASRARAVARLRPRYQSLGLPDPAPPPPRPRFEDQAAALIEARPPVFSFVMGIPDAAILKDARARGIALVGTATTVEEGEALAAAGVDAIVASGSEAGGHRGSWLRPAEASLMGTMSLVPQLASAVPSVPIVAAGGIADGRGVAAALALGADGVQVGTAFLASPEAGAADAHKRLLGTPAARVTRLTRAFTGRHARGIENDLLRELDAHPDDLLPYPAQHLLTLPLRRAAVANGKVELLALWAGQGAPLARRQPAAEVLKRLVEETDRVLKDPRLRSAQPPSTRIRARP